MTNTLEKSICHSSIHDFISSLNERDLRKKILTDLRLPSRKNDDWMYFPVHKLDLSSFKLVNQNSAATVQQNGDFLCFNGTYSCLNERSGVHLSKNDVSVIRTIV